MIGAGVVALLGTSAADLVVAGVSLALMLTTGSQALVPAWKAFKAERLAGPKAADKPEAP
jgi:hypothetical protein